VARLNLLEARKGLKIPILINGRSQSGVKSSSTNISSRHPLIYCTSWFGIHILQEFDGHSTSELGYGQFFNQDSFPSSSPWKIELTIHFLSLAAIQPVGTIQAQIFPLNGVNTVCFDGHLLTLFDWTPAPLQPTQLVANYKELWFLIQDRKDSTTQTAMYALQTSHSAAGAGETQHDQQPESSAASADLDPSKKQIQHELQEASSKSTRDSTNSTAATETKPDTYITIEPPKPAALHASFVSDLSIPDGTVMRFGKSFIKSWKLRNSGTSPWPCDCTLVHQKDEGSSMTSTKVVQLPGDVPPGYDVTINIAMTSPTKAGRHTSFWQMTDPSGNPFGNYVFVDIICKK
jgi:hypothetical protein